MSQQQKNNFIKFVLAVAVVVLMLTGVVIWNSKSDPGNQLAVDQDSAAAVSTTNIDSTGLAASSAESATYTVQAGDTLSTIAEAAGITLAELLELNNMSTGDLINIGDMLVINSAGSLPEDTQTVVSEGAAAYITEIIYEDLPIDYQDTPDLPAGEEVSLSAGSPREIEVTYAINVGEAGEETRTEVKRTIISKGKPEIIEVGIGPATANEEPTVAQSAQLPNSVIDDPAQGLQVGDSRLDVTITSLGINNKTSFSEIAKMSDEEKYAGALNEANRNFMYGTTNYFPLPLATETIDAFNSGQLADFDLVNAYFIELVNEERMSLSVAPLQLSALTIQGANQRSDEMALYGDLRYQNPVTGEEIPHLRPDGTSYETAFTYLPIGINVGENILQDSYRGNPYEIMSERYLANHIFDLFRNSPSHYSNFIMPAYTHNYLSIRLLHQNNDDPQYISFIATQILSIEQ